jgi:hypothetical protein
MGIVRRINNTPLGNGLKKAGPATSAVKLGFTLKQGVPTGSAIIGAYCRRVFIGACTRPFCTLHTGNKVLFWAKPFFPFGIG